MIYHREGLIVSRKNDVLAFANEVDDYLGLKLQGYRQDGLPENHAMILTAERLRDKARSIIAKAGSREKGK